MCTALLPPGVNPIAVNKYIKYHILPGHIRVRILICPSKINPHPSESSTISVSEIGHQFTWPSLCRLLNI